MAYPNESACLANLAVELKIQIFQTLPSLWSAIALRQTCREMNTIYLANETRIRDKYRDRMVRAVDDYYSFLTSFYIDERALRRAPKGGWPAIPLEKTSRPSRDFVFDVARHLPYITPSDHQDNMRNLEYKCESMDHSSGYRGFNMPDDYVEDLLEDYGAVSIDHLIQLTAGYESGGHGWYLDTMTGAVIVDVVRDNLFRVGDIADYFEDLKERFRTLMYVPVLGRDLQGFAHEEPGEDERYASVELVDPAAPRQIYPERDFDLRFARHLYRRFGWPGPNYRKDEALQAIANYKAQYTG